jgi:hypothetical protein
MQEQNVNLQETAAVETVQPATETPQTNNILKLKDEEVYDIDFKGEEAYKSGKRKENGKMFHRYALGLTAFSVPSEHPFNTDFRAGSVKSVTLIKDRKTIDKIDENGDIKPVEMDTLTFSSYVNSAQWETVQKAQVSDLTVEVEKAKAQFAIAKFKTLKTESVSADFLNALLGASA